MTADGVDRVFVYRETIAGSKGRAPSVLRKDLRGCWDRSRIELRSHSGHIPAYVC